MGGIAERLTSTIMYAQALGAKLSVIAGLDPAIHQSSYKTFLQKGMDARVKPAHDRP
jgi:hypothetical protein